MKIRLVNDSDVISILKIYSHYILHTYATFETVVPEIHEFNDRIKSICKEHPWLVCEENEKIIGYAYASKHRAREAYKWSADVTVYIDQDYTGKGYGKILYEKLFQLLKHLGYVNVYAGIALPNISSVAIHESFGFEKIALYFKVGYKMNQWIDVGWWWKQMNKPIVNPVEPISISLIKQDDLNKILS